MGINKALEKIRPGFSDQLHA